MRDTEKGGKPVMLRRCALFFVSLTIPCAFLLLLESCGDENPQGPDTGDPPNGGPDTIAPAAVTGLVAKSPTPSSLALQWVSPGDDGMTGQASGYDIRYSLAVITDQNWNLATQVPDTLLPKPAGQVEIRSVKGLPSSHDVYFALKTYDEASNVSRLSNCPKGTTKTEHLPPAPVTNLAANATADGEFLLAWAAPGDDGMLNGAASEYDVRYSTKPITAENFASADQVTGEPTPSQPDETEHFLVTGLRPGTDYYFALKTADEVQNWSEMSNNGFALAITNFLLVEPQDIYIGLTDTVHVMFRTRALSEKCVVNIMRITWGGEGIVFKHLVNDYYPTGSHHVTWDLKTDDGDDVTSWYGSGRIKLYLNSAPMDTVIIRFFDAP
jgi:hypothetical protein